MVIAYRIEPKSRLIDIEHIYCLLGISLETCHLASFEAWLLCIKNIICTEVCFSGTLDPLQEVLSLHP